MRFGLLGPLHVADDAGHEVSVRPPKQRALLAALLLRANDPVPSVWLIDAVWGDAPPARASDGLRWHLHHLRRLVGQTRICRQPSGYRLTVLPDELDAEVFRRLVDDARRMASEKDLPAAAATFRRALELWRGPALEAFHDGQAMRVEAGMLEDLRLDVHEECLAIDLDLGRHGEVCTELRELVTAHPLRESLRAKLMLALYRSHRSAEALALFEETRKLLVSELGSEPDGDLRLLHQRMLRDDPTLHPTTSRQISNPPTVVRQLPGDTTGFAGSADELGAVSDRPAGRDHDRLGHRWNSGTRTPVARTDVQLVIAASGTAPTVLRDPYVNRIVSTAAAVSAPHGIGVALRWLPLRKPTDLREVAKDRAVAGVLLVNSTESALDAVPTRLHGRVAAIGVGSARVPSFDVDNAAAVTGILEHMYAAGRRRIVLVAGAGWLPCVERPLSSYRTIMEIAGLPIRIVRGDFTAASGQAAAFKALSRWPDTDAILACNDAMAVGALTALHRHGAHVPGDIAVAGFDDVAFAPYTDPALTTATHPVEHIAAAAATAVLERTEPPPVTMFRSDVVLRESA